VACLLTTVYCVWKNQKVQAKQTSKSTKHQHSPVIQQLS